MAGVVVLPPGEGRAFPNFRGPKSRLDKSSKTPMTATSWMPRRALTSRFMVVSALIAGSELIVGSESMVTNVYSRGVKNVR